MPNPGLHQARFLSARAGRLARIKYAWLAPGRLEAARYGRSDARRYERAAELALLQ